MKLLVSVDPSDFALKIARYVASVARPDVAVTLFTVLPSVSSKMERELYHPLFAQKMETLRQMDKQQKEVMEKTMQECSDILQQAGINNVQIRIEEKKRGVARDIIARADSGSFDTLVLGKRGQSGGSSFVLGSVSQKVLNNLKNKPVWVVE